MTAAGAAPDRGGSSAHGPARFGRRAAVRGGAFALVAATLRPAPARAADEGALLLGLWRLETGAAFAYEAIAGADPLLAVLSAHETSHAKALATQLAAVGLATPRQPERTEELDSAAKRLATAADVIGAAIALEERLVDIYRSALGSLPDPQVAMTAATILASHAQHLAALRLARRDTLS